MVVKLLLKDRFIALLSILSFWFCIYLPILDSTLFFWLAKEESNCVASKPDVDSAVFVN